MAVELNRVWGLGSGVWGKFEPRYLGGYATAESSRLSGTR